MHFGEESLAETAGVIDVDIPLEYIYNDRRLPLVFMIPYSNRISTFGRYKFQEYEMLY